jgi:hypothetical protein
MEGGLAMNTHPHPDLIGKIYVNPEDSGDLVMEVLPYLPPIPEDVVVRPIGYNRCWAYNASIIRQLIAEQEAQYIPFKGVKHIGHTPATAHNVTLPCGCRTDGATMCDEYRDLQQAAFAALDKHTETGLDADWQAACDILDAMEEHRRPLWED